MKILIVKGIEKDLPWDELNQSCEEYHIALYGLRSVLRDIVGEVLCIDPDDCDVEQLIDELGRSLHTVYPMWFHRRILFQSNNLSQMPSSWNAAQNLLVFYDQITPEQLEVFRHGLPHEARFMLFGPPPTTPLQPDFHYDIKPDLAGFMEKVLPYFGIPTPKEEQEEQEMEDEWEEEHEEKLEMEEEEA